MYKLVTWVTPERIKMENHCHYKDVSEGDLLNTVTVRTKGQSIDSRHCEGNDSDEAIYGLIALKEEMKKSSVIG